MPSNIDLYVDPTKNGTRALRSIDIWRLPLAVRNGIWWGAYDILWLIKAVETVATENMPPEASIKGHKWDTLLFHTKIYWRLHRYFPLKTHVKCHSSVKVICLVSHHVLWRIIMSQTLCSNLRSMVCKTKTWENACWNVHYCKWA